MVRQSGAKINITDGSCPERIVTVTGSTDAIFKGFQLITKKLEEVIERNQNEFGVSIFRNGFRPFHSTFFVASFSFSL